MLNPMTSKTQYFVSHVAKDEELERCEIAGATRVFCGSDKTLTRQDTEAGEQHRACSSGI
jgi:hypothetical protein